VKKLQKGFTLIELMIVVAIIGILAAIAIPNFIKFQAKSKQSEAKSNLKALFTAEKAFFQEKDRYDTGVSFVGFSPERNNRFLYATTPAAPTNPELRTGAVIVPPAPNTSFDSIEVDEFKWGAPAQAAALGGYQAASGCGYNIGLSNLADGTAVFTGEAIGNVDSDTQIDLWTISTASRNGGTACDETVGQKDATGAPNTTVSGGQPANDINDVNR
jgi:type IV pilus assembly protein PilA